MSIDKPTVRLLLLEDSQNEAERLVSLFRNAGHPTRVQRIFDSDSLESALKSAWDLCIAAPECELLAPRAALKAIMRTGREIAFIQLQENHNSEQYTEFLQLGARDVLIQGHDKHLLLVAARELAALTTRRAVNTLEIALQEAEKRCQLLLDSSVDAIAYVLDGMHIYANPAYARLFGHSDPDDLEGMSVIDLIAAEDQAAFKSFFRSYRRDNGSAEFECNGQASDGRNLALSMSFSPASYDGEPCIQLIIRNEQNSQALKEKLRNVSKQDPATGLYNRQKFLELLGLATEKAVKDEQVSSLAYIRIDHYDHLTDTLGLAAIDSLLAQLAEVASTQLPDSQLARLSDDVICALQSGITPEQHANALQSLLQQVAGQLFEIDQQSVQVTLSIGVAALTDKTTKAVEVLDRARRCSESQLGGNHLHVHNPVAELEASAQSGDMIAMVQHALATNSFKLLFQPVISLRGDKEELYEVLLRMIGPQGEEVAPAEFIQAAIDARLADKLDRWVLLNVIKLLAQHKARGHKASLFVHLSSASLQDLSLLQWLTLALKAARLPDNTLILQIRETDAVSNLRQVVPLIQGLKQLNCQISLGQFGCAINPFGTLQHLAVDYVKIDGSFTRELQNPEQQAALKEILRQLREQGKQSIVPFVESASILSVLWQAGVDYIQGHYLQSPTDSMEYNFGSDDA